MAEIGDLIPKSGVNTEPGVIIQKQDNGTVSVDTEPLSISKYHRYTNTTGLTEAEKNKFNSILDKIYASEDDVEKMNQLQGTIDNLKIDPINTKVVQYLRNQQSFLIRSAKQLPRSYNMDESKVRSGG